MSILVRSLQEEVRFRARIHISWLGRATDPKTPETVALVAQLAKEATEKITSQFSVVHLREAQDALTSRLSLDEQLQIDAFLEAKLEVFLDAEPAAVEIAQRFERMRMEGAFTQAQHLLRFQQWDELHQEVLCVPHRARLWWLDGRSDRLEQLVAMGETFEQAAALLTPAFETARAPSPTARLTDVIDRFLGGLGPEQHQLLLQQLSRVFVSYERPDLADAIQEVANTLGTATPRQRSLAADSGETSEHEMVRGYP
jgi:hypothetical protein